MELTLQPFFRARVERVVGAVRLALAASSLLAVWLDPAVPPGLAQFTRSLHVFYMAYALVVGAITWPRETSGRVALATHITDVAVAAILQYLSAGSASPFFTYFVFTLFAASLRWGWRATVQTAGCVLVLYLAMGWLLSRTQGTAFDVNRFVVRTAYLMVVTVVLVFRGQYQMGLRREVGRLARWPRPEPGDWATTVPRTLEHAAGILGAGRGTVVWSADDEPWVYVASWPAGPEGIIKQPPGEVEPPVPDDLTDCTFISPDRVTPDARWAVSRQDALTQWTGLAVHARLLSRVDGAGLVSAPFQTDLLAGRIFFADLTTPTAELMSLAKVVAREIGASLDQLQSYERSQRLAIAEDRIRLARDLHDGVLQSLTGVRLELQTLARPEPGAALPPLMSDRLVAIERALALEQRDLRRFIEDLRPSPESTGGISLADRLDDIRRRMSLQWRAPVSIRVSPPELTVQAHFDHAVPLMVHEAVVNALKHGRPTRVSVDIHTTGDLLRVIVSDDGCGFSFSGRYDHAALVASNAGPVSLRERVASLGGAMAIESGPAGARVELTLPLEAVHA